MSRSPPVVIVGSGIVGALIADQLARRGVASDIVEKGADIAYPPGDAFEREVLFGERSQLPQPRADVKHLTRSGSYRRDVNAERLMVVGGSATRWGAMCDRMHPHDFTTRSRYGFGADWPLTYQQLEPYYGEAERLLGVAGEDDDPFAAPRSSRYPLPPFRFGHDARLLTGRLLDRGMRFATSPQARTSAPYDGRPACANFGTCAVCPLGARYSPHHHLRRATATGHARLLPDTSVRRVLLDGQGRARAVLVRHHGDRTDRELPAAAVVVCAGAIESVRLLLLSTSGAAPDGLGNAGGQLGQHLMFHHIWGAHLEFPVDLYPGRIGAEMAQCRQFLDPATRGRHGGVLLQIPSRPYELFHQPDLDGVADGQDLLRQLRPRLRCQLVWLHAESTPAEGKHITLGAERDRFGDRFAQVAYSPCEFDHLTYRYARGLLDRIAQATGASEVRVRDEDDFASGFHHMGGCRMGRTARDGVVDARGRVFGTRNVYVAGGAVFPTAGAVHPTLTMAALAVRTGQTLLARLGA